MTSASRIPDLRSQRGFRWFGAIFLLLASTLVSAFTCGVPAGPPIAPPATPSTATAGAVGYLEGRASIGPLTPVEKTSVPSPTPSPAVCTARGLTVRDAKSDKEVARFSLAGDCTYRVALKPGAYVVDLVRTQRIGGSKDLPKTVEIESGKTVRLDISIDTGIR